MTCRRRGVSLLADGSDGAEPISSKGGVRSLSTCRRWQKEEWEWRVWRAVHNWMACRSGWWGNVGGICDSAHRFVRPFIYVSGRSLNGVVTIGPAWLKHLALRKRKGPSHPALALAVAYLWSKLGYPHGLYDASLTRTRTKFIVAFQPLLALC